MKILEFIGALMFLAAVALFFSDPKGALSSVADVLESPTPRIGPQR
ncbi:MAG: hypothetical protein R3B54_10100 [Bdellovibrionota bacterium]